MNNFSFDSSFEALTGHAPFPWQRRLFGEFQAGRLPPAIDIPTGLGKTAVMAIWLLARSVGAPLPRRLAYVVDRRAVVDQATDFAEGLRRALRVEESLAHVRRGLGIAGRFLPISTLRGQHIDNREWLDDPAAPAIIVATVDMVGSRLLFEGYGVSRRMRPYHAGMLGCDTLVLLDEAHLSRPFEALLRTIEVERRMPDGPESEPGKFGGQSANARVPPPIRVLPLSATLGFSPCSESPFTIDREDRTHETVRARLEALKVLQIEELGSDSRLDAELAARAWHLALQQGKAVASPVRTLIYCNSRKIAEGVKERLLKRDNEDRTGAEVILFVGGRRVYEREAAARELQRLGLLADSDGPPDSPVFVVATSAGEVGVDLDADHMVCDLVPWERMVQRLGRVNRRGLGDARIVVIDQGPPRDESGSARHSAVKALLRGLPSWEGGHLAGLTAITAAGQLAERRDLTIRASTPVPLYPELSRPLVDAWAMTSLPEHSGRPEVEPWLRGWVKQDPQTTVVWRRFLPVCVHSADYCVQVEPLHETKVEEFFDAAAPLLGEQLQTETSRVADWLRKSARRLERFLNKPEVHRRELEAAHADSSKDPSAVSSADAPAPLHGEAPIAFVLGGGGFEGVIRLSDAAINLKPKDLVRQLAGRLIVVDARICGLIDGLLEAGNGESVPTAEDNWGDPDACKGLPADNSRPSALLAVRVRLLGDDDRRRMLEGQEAEVTSEERMHVAWHEAWAAPYRVSADDNVSTWLVVQKWRAEVSDEDSRAMAPAFQQLQAHQELAAREAERIATDLGLPLADRAMLVAAARRHDEGKRASRWQRAFHAPRHGGPYAKTPGPVNRHVLNGYRHELQSMIDAEREGLVGLERSDPRFDLALHLIAAHHGNARPVIGTDGCDVLPPTAAARRAFEAGRRFARLQRQWGPWGLAWWEALLRAADQRASRVLDATVLREQRQAGRDSPTTVG